MKQESSRPPSEERDAIAGRARRTARQMRWAVRGMLALAALLAALWVLMMRR